MDCHPSSIVFSLVSDIIKLHNYFSSNLRKDIYKVWDGAIPGKQRQSCNTLGALQRGVASFPFRNFDVIFLHTNFQHSHSSQHPSAPAEGRGGLALLSVPVDLDHLEGGDLMGDCWPLWEFGESSKSTLQTNFKSFTDACMKKIRISSRDYEKLENL